MSITGLLLSFTLFVILLLVMFYPMLRHADRSTDAMLSRQRERALAYYERVLNNVSDLDEDHATGKIAADEYQRERAFWVERGVKILKLLDELDEQHAILQDVEADDAAIDHAIEEALITGNMQPERTQEAS